MNKLLLMLAPTLFILSCQKDVVKPTAISPTDEVAFSNRNNIVFDSVVTRPATNYKLYDTCLQEYIDFSGLITYKYKTVGPTNTFYYIYYELDFNGITGIGENSGTIYTGGGISKGMTKAKWNFSGFDTSWNDFNSGYTLDSVFTNTLTLGKDFYKAKYTSATGEISVKLNNKFKQVNGITVIDTGGKPAIISCKEY